MMMTGKRGADRILSAPAYESRTLRCYCQLSSFRWRWCRGGLHAVHSDQPTEVSSRAFFLRLDRQGNG